MTVDKNHSSRRWTPLTLTILAACMAAGFGFIGWCGDSAVKVFTSHFDSLEKKQDIMFQALRSIKEKEYTDVKCLNNNIFKSGHCPTCEVC